MRSMEAYPRAAMERAMKVQDVMLQAMAKKITWWQAAEILGISDRHLRRWRERYAEFGFRGLFDRRRGRPSPKRVPVAVVERVLGLYRERYFDLNLRHFHEKLAEHQIRLSYSWVKGILQGRGWWRRGASEESPASGDRDGRYRGCCCISTAVGTTGFRTSAGTTCWWCSTMPPARSTTPNWWKRNPPARCWRRCGKWSSAAGFSARCTAIATAIFLKRPKRGGRSIRGSSRKWAERCRNWAFR